MIPVAEALSQVLALARPTEPETVRLQQACGRVPVGPLAARRDQPPFDASAMDGYAFRGPARIGDTLRIVGESQAGGGYAGTLTDGEAVRISTGAPIPDGATHVVMQEDTRREGERLIFTADVPTVRHIRRRGQDFHAGQPFAPRRLRPADLALLAAMDVPELAVYRRPVIAIIATGDELEMPGSPMRDDQIPAANGFALKAMVEAEGAIGRMLPIARDDADHLRAVFELARGADVIVTIGGASVGDHDKVAEVSAAMGMSRTFHKVAMRPGKPLMAGRFGETPMLGLPGNPVSAIVCAHLFLLPLIRAMTGREAEHQMRHAPLTADLPENGPRAHYMRAHVGPDGIVPFAEQDSSLMLRLTEANALLVRPPHDPPRRAGEIAAYLPF
ncbi:molybdopterin molybdotransferase MoeA [Falsirhodobacter algicola]|uniref:Molybdopterin molybdenumtransferase n=1 Tax=Falsirhodobacter algicola TaxID=2692330 RepID=A0A8J8MRJ0_9RHOB|nr:molybdopterin molybdotransferase MoeA [Falsirhodobacter algicola]QUS35199.1 molybdopterin molybdenumtransferase MoeA [Falsirhodobacter algicola]